MRLYGECVRQSTRRRSGRQEVGQRHVRVDRPMLLGRNGANGGTWRDRPSSPFQCTPVTTVPTSSGADTIGTISPEVTTLPPATAAAATRREATPVQPPRERDEDDPFARPAIQSAEENLHATPLDRWDEDSSSGAKRRGTWRETTGSRTARSGRAGSMEGRDERSPLCAR